MGQKPGNKPETKGAFVIGFSAAVAEISKAFEKQIQNILAENGIEDADPEGSYSMDAVVSSVNQMADNVGETTTHKIGIHQVTIPEWPDEVDTVEKGFGALNDAYRDAYVNFSEDELGRFQFEKTGDNKGRAAIPENYPYPPAFASGIFEGILNEFGSKKALTEVSEIEPEADEKAAYELRW